MKKVFSFLRVNIVPIGGVFLMALIFSACKKTDSNNQTIPAAGLVAINLVPDVEAVGVAISGNNFTNVPLYYSNYTGAYRAVYTGQRSLESYNFNNRQSMAMTNQLFKDSSYYTLFVVGTQGNYKNVMVEDKLDSLPTNTGESFVRFVNAITDSTNIPNVKIASGSNVLYNGVAPFGYVSDFKAVMPGDVMIEAGNESTIDKNRTISVEKGKVYTVLLSGDPSATDTAKTVSIKFIINGSVSE